MTDYYEDELGFLPDAGNVGGDDQVSAAPERRFIRDLEDGTFAVVTVNAYVTRSDEEDDDLATLDVLEQIEWVHCRDIEDPGSSEINRDYTYSYPFDFSPESIDVGLDWATNHVKNFDPDHIAWDGVSPIQH